MPAALVLESGGQYFLLPATWSQDSGTAIVLPRSGALRLEFSSASGRARTSC